MPVPRTPSDAYVEAREHLRFGWFQDSDTTGYVRCPVCRTHVRAAWFAWTTDGGRGIALRSVLAEHLLDEHPTKEGTP